MYSTSSECFCAAMYVCSCETIDTGLIQTSDVWSMAEMCTAIMVVSLPSLRPLLRKNQPSTSSPDTSNPHRSSEKPPSRATNRMRHSITSSRDAYTINNSEISEASDLELVDVSHKGKDEWRTEHVEVHQHRGLEQQIRLQRQLPRRMESFDSKTPHERSKEWV